MTLDNVIIPHHKLGAGASIESLFFDASKSNSIRLYNIVTSQTVTDNRDVTHSSSHHRLVTSRAIPDRHSSILWRHGPFLWRHGPFLWRHGLFRSQPYSNLLARVSSHQLAAHPLTGCRLRPPARFVCSECAWSVLFCMLYCVPL